MNSTTFDARLRPAHQWMRAGFLVGMAGLILGLRALDPVSLSWLPLRTSCGALTGLPCIFCGTTRALHHLLLGHFAQALYFNWLSFVVSAAALALIMICSAELVTRRRILSWPRFHLTPRLTAIAAIALVALWILQGTLAVSMHKRELLNPNGLLYAVFVKG